MIKSRTKDMIILPARKRSLTSLIASTLIEELDCADPGEAALFGLGDAPSAASAVVPVDDVLLAEGSS